MKLHILSWFVWLSFDVGPALTLIQTKSISSHVNATAWVLQNDRFQKAQQQTQTKSTSSKLNATAKVLQNARFQKPRQQFQITRNSSTLNATAKVLENARLQQAQQQTQSTQPSFVVLLTTYNEPSRTEMYEKRLKWWLTKTTLPIYVVDSYNAQFPEYLRSIRTFREYHFDQTPVLGTPPRGGSTPAEILSMKNAFEVFKDEWAQYDYVVKITGKYVLPTLTSSFAAMSKGRAFIVQSANYNVYPTWPGWIGTECLGFNAKRMGELLAVIEAQKALPIESKVAGLLWDEGIYSHQRLPLMPVPEAYQIARGDGMKLPLLTQKVL